MSNCDIQQKNEAALVCRGIGFRLRTVAAGRRESDGVFSGSRNGQKVIKLSLAVAQG